MRVIPGSVETVLLHVSLGTSVLAMFWTAYVAFYLESFSLATSALYQFAVIALYRGRFGAAASKDIETGEGAMMRLALIIVLLIPSPFLAGGAVHALNHASGLPPGDMLPAAIGAFVAGTLRTLYVWRFRRQGGAVFLIRAALATLPFIAPLVVVGSIAAGLDHVDAAIGITLVLILLLAVLAPQLFYLSRLFG